MINRSSAAGAGPRDEVSFVSDGETLVGTLLLPGGATGGDAGPVPGVLLLPGSGPIDRDSNHRGVRLDVTRLLAEALAEVGIGSFRYDKRGVGASSGDFLRTGFVDNRRDARAALDLLVGRPEIDPDRVVVLGHSEGALHAVELGADATTRLAGLVLLAGAACRGEEVLTYQVGAIVPLLPAPVRGLLRLLRLDVAAHQQKRFAALRATTADRTGWGPTRTNARWWREFLDADPRPALAAITTPVLAVTGERDVQVDPADADTIAATVADGRSYRAPGVTHILRRTTHAGGPSTYRRQAREPLAPDVVDRVVAFTRGVTTRPAPRAAPSIR